MLKDKITTLEQLLLSKRQLIWNLEFELLSLTAIDKPIIDKAEIMANIPADILKKMKENLNHNTREKASRIEYTKKEIELLEKYIEELNTVKVT